ncbi:hypothetical protein [Paenibacillus sp. FSL H7-0331]|uniref:hypothetical protein n=1 Tax=Paenibacillus sp. FSL H7-0331 TaxID=1920421 RepID=UPI00096FC029|nr:hypothetical protein [Paenibacillus sp. FSL H7-0331]OMF14698.1 hypothetical protein BK127_18470 [Paenibacillus sp. FSL H7-0331]
MTVFIHTEPLPPGRAHLVENLIQDIIPLHPGIDGFILTGSIWNPDTQLPHSDIDINWHGTKNDSINDPRLNPHSIFQEAGITIEMANYFWGDLSRPETMRLSVIVSLNRAHILWEKEGRFSNPQQQTRRLLRNAQWVEAAIDRSLSELTVHANNWLDPIYIKNNKDNHHAFDFVRTVVGPTVGLLDSIDLRPPSAARKGLMEITQTSLLCGLPDVSESILRCLGADAITAVEVEEWNRLLSDLYSHVASLCPEVQLVKREYHVLGIQTMISMGYPRECIWPLWRGFIDCKHLLNGVSPRGEEAFVQFAERLQVHTAEDIGEKAVQYAAIVERLQSQQKKLSDYLLRKVK